MDAQIFGKIQDAASGLFKRSLTIGGAVVAELQDEVRTAAVVQKMSKAEWKKYGRVMSGREKSERRQLARKSRAAERRSKKDWGGPLPS